MNSKSFKLIGKECLAFDENNKGTSLKVSRNSDFIIMNLNENNEFSLNSRCESPYGTFKCNFAKNKPDAWSNTQLLTFTPKTGDTKLKIKLDQTDFGVIPYFELKSPVKISDKTIFVKSVYSKGKNDFSFGSRFSIDKINTIIDFVYGKTLFSKIFVSYPFLNQKLILSTEKIVAETNVGNETLFGTFKYTSLFESKSYFFGVHANYKIGDAGLMVNINNDKSKTIKFANETAINNKTKIGFSIINDFANSTVYDIGCSFDIKGVNSKLKYSKVTGTSISFSKNFNLVELKTCVTNESFKKFAPSLSFSVEIM